MQQQSITYGLLMRCHSVSHSEMKDFEELECVINLHQAVPKRKEFQINLTGILVDIFKRHLKGIGILFQRRSLDKFLSQSDTKQK